ncbi:MAG: LLM class flavin-dependent oxidoreductase [Brachybacterium sp.]|nr:LLM class flavin-dependent oxidoreductase [Brachybacterium sp.]
MNQTPTQPSTAPLLLVELPTAPEVSAALPALAREVETAGIHGVTLGDGALHPVHLAAFLAPTTERLLLLPHTDAVYVEPFHLATQLASLDHISAGRAGYLVGADPAGSALAIAQAQAVGREPLDAAATAREVDDVLRTLRLLWDSWADNAVVRDLEHGRYVDAARLQYVDVEAATFRVRGPAITPRPPQGQVPILVAEPERGVIGEETVTARADGIVWDQEVDLRGVAAERVEDELATRLEEATADQVPRAVRLRPDPAAITDTVTARGEAGLREVTASFARAAESLRERGLIAPDGPVGASARELLGLTRPEVTIDIARRADRARTEGVPA